MSTHAAIGRRTGETSWESTYVHFDGYPESTGVELSRIVARDGAEKTLKTLLSHSDWRFIDSNTLGGPGSLDGGERSRAELGVGEYYTDTDPDASLQTNVRNSVHWVYLIAEDGSVETLSLYS